MRVFILLLFFTVTFNFFSPYWMKCYAATYDATGTWSYSFKNKWINGPCIWNLYMEGTAVVTQTGNSIEAVENHNGSTYKGTVSGARYIISGSYPDSGGTTAITLDFTLTSSSSGTGYMTLHWTNGTYNCNGGADISMTKIIISMDTVYVDFTYKGTESGTESQPYNALAEAIEAVSKGGEIIIKAGMTNETFEGINKINKKVTIISSSGVAVIGKQP